jgi:UDP-N-acetylmuramoylalanine--D-glutamate ligase
MNIMAAICVCKIIDIPDVTISDAINNFRGLRHRMEYLGQFKGIHFYNDSIATIPEATISAIKSLQKVDTLILGGKDRGINYQSLIDYLPASDVNNLVFIGEAGNRIMKGLKSGGKLKNQKLFFIYRFNELPEIIKQNTLPEHICLLSPAASSYDMFSNFEERGDVFKKIAENL